MLHLTNLTITHQKDLHVIIKELSLVVNSGDKLAIIGEEGTGKSSLIQAIVAPEKLAQYAYFDGDIINRFNRVGYLPQQLAAHQLEQTVTDFIYSDMDYERFDFQLFWTLAERFGLAIEAFEDNKQSLSTLSGGEKIKLQLLKLLAYDPDVLILDEPSGDLDLATLTWLEEFIQETDKTVIFISHDEALLSKAASSILHLELLQKRREPRWTVYKGGYEDYKKDRRERFDKQLQVANKERDEHTKRLQENHRIQQRVEHQLRGTKNDVLGRLLAKKMKALKSQEGRFERQAQEFTEIPQDMDKIKVFFSDVQPLPARKVILSWEGERLSTGQELDLTIRGQDRIAIVGKNGAGKTRLLEKIRQELTQRDDVSLGYMPQDYHQVLPLEDSALAFLTDTVGVEEARTLLASLQLTREEIHHSARALSGGQKAKLCLVKMVLDKSNVLLLDEPTRHLSPTSQEEFRQVLKDYPGAIILVTHDRSLLSAMPWQILEL